MDIDPGRLLGLTDGIFGMVMTLLVFGMALPEIKILTYGDFIGFIHSIAPTFGVTIVSFILVSSFWVYHHEFIKINNLNMPYLWINILFLASISFIPFSTTIIGTYSHFFLSEVIFGINIFLTLLLFMIMYTYAYRRGFLENKPSKEEIYLFLLVPVISTIRDINFKMKS